TCASFRNKAAAASPARPVSRDGCARLRHTGPDMPDTPPRMTSHRPYLLRALYEWIADNGMTPHILVDARQPGVNVPMHSVKDGRVVLNIAERAVARLEMDN